MSQAFVRLSQDANKPDGGARSADKPSGRLSQDANKPDGGARSADRKASGREGHPAIQVAQVLTSPARPWNDVNFNRWQAGVTLPRHAHPFLQTIHVLEGELEVDVGDGWKRLAPGAVHLLPPRYPHRLRTEKGHRQFGINFTAERDERGLLAALLPQVEAPLILELPFLRRWETSLREAARGTTVGQLRALHTLEEYALELLALLAPRDGGSEAQRITRFLQARLERPVPVPEAAQHLGLSRVSLQRACHKHFGCGLAHLHERMRLEAGALALRSGSEPVGAVAERLGYGDLFRFSRAFKRVFHRSPSQYRKQALAGF